MSVKAHLVANKLLDDGPANTDQTQQWDDKTDQVLQVIQYGLVGMWICIWHIYWIIAITSLDLITK